MSIFKMFVMTALAGVVMGLYAGIASAATQHMAAPAAAQNGGWTHLGGDPLVPGGVNSRSAFVHVVTSSKGQTAMTYAGLNSAERKAVTLQVREGNFSSCTMAYGETFWKMSFGINGTSVDQNVRFADSRYMGGAPSWCVTAVVGGKGGYRVTVKMPRKCGNVAVPHKPSRKLPAKPKKKVVTTTTPTGGCNAVNSPGANVCSTVTYVNVCGTQVIYNGDQKDLTTWTNQYIADHCQPTVTTQVCSIAGASNYGQAGPCVIPTPVPTPCG